LPVFIDVGTFVIPRFARITNPPADPRSTLAADTAGPPSPRSPPPSFTPSTPFAPPDVPLPPSPFDPPPSPVLPDVPPDVPFPETALLPSLPQAPLAAETTNSNAAAATVAKLRFDLDRVLGIENIR
jgi:hypothetical protein